MKKIDVIKVMDRLIAQQELHIYGERPITEARAAVSELLEAGRAYVDARATYNDAVNRRGLVGQRDARLAMEAAKKRHIAILERIGETK